MAFWSQPDLEPKRQFRFEVQFGLLAGNGATNSDTYLAQYADRPTYQIKGDTAVHFLDKQFMFPGKITWNPVKLRFVDVVAGAVNPSTSTYEYLNRAGWINPKEVAPDKFGTINKKSSVGSGTKHVKVNVLDADGNPIDRWVLNNAFITTVAMNNLEYAQDGILTVEYTIVYDWADLNLNTT